MNRLDEITIGDIGRTLGRYRPFIAVLTGILMVAVFLPGEQRSGSDTAADLTNPSQQGQTGFTNQASAPAGSSADTDGGSGTGGSTVATSGGGGSGTDGGEVSGAPADGGDGSVGGDGGDEQVVQQTGGGGLNATCDEAAGHIAIPSLVAPPCVQTAPSTGDDYQGVTEDTIKVAYYLAQDDPTSDAILAAAGVDDSDEEVKQQVRDYVDYYQHHYETYGREIEVVFVKGRGDASDDEAAVADARKVAQEIGAIASWTSPNNTYVEELAAHGVMCTGCQVSQPVENYQSIAPHSWGTLMASTEGYIHRAEYAGKRLWQAGKKAEHAGDATMQLEDRKFGLLYYNNGGAYESGAAFFEQHLRDEYGVELAARRDYEGFPKTEESQQAARPLIQAMIDAGVTTVLCACDPFAPVFFTQEATRQNYFPEWMITGSALTDTTFFARTYDQNQWENAFGISFLTARVPEEISETLRLLKWHFGDDYEPPADSYGTIRSSIHLFMTGVHLAGPTLTPQTFQQGMFNMAPLGTGHIMQQTVSFGQQNWPHDSYTAYDDITMIWWDRNATGEDEIGGQGVGMYRYVDMGKRYMPGEQPVAPPKAFQTENTVMVYDDYPPGDEPPQYEHEE